MLKTRERINDSIHLMYLLMWILQKCTEETYGQIDTLEMYLDMDILEFDENVSRY